MGSYGDLNGITAGQSYTFEAYVYVPSGQGITLSNVYLIIYDNQEGWEGSFSSVVTAYDEWQPLTVTRTIRSSATEAIVRVQINQDIQYVYIYADDMSLRKTSIPGTEYDIRDGSLKLIKQCNGRSTCDFTIYHPTLSLHFGKGQQVSITLDDAQTFVGYVDRTVERPYGPGKEHFLSCVDKASLADRIRIKGDFNNTSAATIVKYIVDNKLADLGVYYTDESIYESNLCPDTDLYPADDLYPIENNVMECSPDNITCADLSDDLGERAGCWWDIADDGLMKFLQLSAESASWSLTDLGMLMDSTSYTPSADYYRNVQIVKNTGGLKTGLSAQFKGDNVSRTYVLGYPLAKVPTLKLNTVTQTNIGIKGLSTGKEWYWSKGDSVLERDVNYSPLSPSDILEVEYTGLYTSYVSAEDSDEITRMAALDGTNGRYEHVVEVNGLTDEAAEELAEGLLARYATESGEFRFSTITAGLEPGQMLTITSTKHDIDDDFFIESISTYATRPYVYEVRCVSGYLVGDWTRRL